ncbi:hypothetical protein LPJ66_003711 [Kickxella alabastrina]|uniref:Uncharacterized protein n=1 Tax=Kickxella alabastrina TaxID=61397 RepID=A0ACC1IP05_9FUNG|nr:hypothetical protein LPJ66_003711 [Kickxella alabastrina]
MEKQFALRTEYHWWMIDLGFLPALLGGARQSVSELKPLCALMESLVWPCAFLTAYRPPEAEENATEVANLQMVRLLELGAVNIIAACVRQDDQGMSSWGVEFLHDVSKVQLAASPRLVCWLCRKLAAGKYVYTNQMMLHSPWCLCTSQEVAVALATLTEVAQPDNLQHMLATFVSDDDADVHYWSVALISRVSVPALMHQWIIRSLLPQAMASVAEMLMPEMAGIISCLCHSIDVAPMMTESSMAVINTAVTSCGFLQLLMADDAIKTWLVELALANGSSNGPTQSYAAKGLVALMYAGQVDAKDVVCNVLVLLLRQMESMYLNTLDLAFYPISDSDEVLSEVAITCTKLGQPMNAV